MDIKSRLIRIRDLVIKNKNNLIICVEFVLVAAIFFGLGVLYDRSMLKDDNQISIIEPKAGSLLPTPATSTLKDVGLIEGVVAAPVRAGDFVASKNGTAYYSLMCRNNIKEENKIYFQTKDDAEKAGFKPAKNCFQ